MQFEYKYKVMDKCIGDMGHMLFGAQGSSITMLSEGYYLE